MFWKRLSHTSWCVDFSVTEFSLAGEKYYAVPSRKSV